MLTRLPPTEASCWTGLQPPGSAVLFGLTWRTGRPLRGGGLNELVCGQAAQLAGSWHGALGMGAGQLWVGPAVSAPPPRNRRPWGLGWSPVSWLVDQGGWGLGPQVFHWTQWRGGGPRLGVVPW